MLAPTYRAYIERTGTQGIRRLLGRDDAFVRLEVKSKENPWIRDNELHVTVCIATPEHRWPDMCIGSCRLDLIVPGMPYTIISYNLGVSEKFRRQGISSFLMTIKYIIARHWFADTFSEENTDDAVMIARVNADNSAQHAALEKAGWSRYTSVLWGITLTEMETRIQEGGENAHDRMF